MSDEALRELERVCIQEPCGASRLAYWTALRRSGRFPGEENPRGTIPHALTDSDWGYVFSYTGEHDPTHYGGPEGPCEFAPLGVVCAAHGGRQSVDPVDIRTESDREAARRQDYDELVASRIPGQDIAAFWNQKQRERKNVNSALPGGNVDCAPFGRADIRYLYAHEDGVGDEKNWLALVELWDGRFAFVSSGCDYTGWD